MKLNRRGFLKTALLAIVGAVLGKGLSWDQVETKLKPATDDGGYVVPASYAEYLKHTYNESVASRRISLPRSLVGPPYHLCGVEAQWVDEDEEIQVRSLPFYGDSDCPGRPAFSWDEDDERT